MGPDLSALPAAVETLPADSRGHCCECMCDRCAKNETGYFAQRAALDGNVAAAVHFAPGIFRTLAAIAAKRIARRSSRRRSRREGIAS